MNYGLVNKPRNPGATMRVWEIADEISRQKGRPARRKEVIEACVAEGGNPNTASTQYHYWKQAQSEEPRPERTARGVPDAVRLRVERDGRVMLPPDIVRAMKLDENGVVSARIEDGVLRMIPVREEARRARGILAHLREERESVVDEFLAERHAAWGEE